MKIFKLSNVLAIFLIIGVLISCGTEYQPSKENNGDQQPDDTDTTSTTITPNDPVPADATLKATTWNLEAYGSDFTQPGEEGEYDKKLQLKNILTVTDSLKADFYAFEEVGKQQSLDNILDNMTGYHGFTADYISYDQRMAVAFNTNTIDSLTSGKIEDVKGITDGDWNNYWASGRLPLYFKFKYTYNEITPPKTFYAVVIHGKANTGKDAEEYKEAYQRRKNAAEGLYKYLTMNKPDANIILLGDYNDDVDESIYYDSEGNYPESPYHNFVSDTQHYDVLTETFSNNDESAFIGSDDSDDPVDHITISDELVDEYVQSSVQIYDAPQNYITNYEQTTSDHLPVWAKFDVTASN